MLEFFKTRKFKVIVAIAAVIFGMMLYAASGDGIANIPRNLLQMVTSPLQKAASAVSSGIGSFLDVFVNARDHAEENEELKAQLAEYYQLRIDYERLKEENEELKKVTGIKEVHPDFEMVIASVISRDPADRYSSFLIDQGTLNGVKQNDPVITENGLVGIITKVGPTSARVQTILSPEIDIGVSEVVSKELGVIQGEVSLAQRGQTKLSILSRETGIKPGDLIVTTGVSGLYPKDLPVGLVASVEDEPHGVTKYAVVNPMESVGKVDTVTVIIGFQGQGSQPVDDTE